MRFENLQQLVASAESLTEAVSTATMPDARAHLTNAPAWADDSKKARTETIQDGKGSSLIS